VLRRAAAGRQGWYNPNSSALVPQQHGKPMTDLTGPPRPAVRLFFAAFLMLFLELVLIRYLAGNVWNMGQQFPEDDQTQ